MSYSATSPSPINIKPSDRLGLTLFFAAALHAMLILGISFSNQDRDQAEDNLTFEVTLVHSKSDATPKDADYLAQVNQQGGGTVEEKLRPSSPYPKRYPVEDERGNSPQEQPLSAAPQAVNSQPHSVITTAQPSTHTALEQPNPRPDVPDTIRAADLMLRSREIARISAEIREKQQIYAKLPREKVITANTREYEYAAYEEGWRMKVERVGNLNYPDEARRNKLSGNLLLAVTINVDGSLREVKVRRSSGHKLLDDAAVRIVKMAAPYAPFPDTFRNKQDVLTIVRTWQFSSNSQLSSR